MHPTDVAAPGGVFGRLGNVAVRWPLLIIGCWIALAAVLTLAFPSMAEVAAQNLPEFPPANAPVVVTSGQTAKAFHETGSDNVLLAVLTDEKGLGPAYEKTYRTVVDKLRQDKRDVKTVQDFMSTLPLQEVLTSKDNGRHRHMHLPLSRVPLVVRNGRSNHAMPSHMAKKDEQPAAEQEMPEILTLANADSN